MSDGIGLSNTGSPTSTYEAYLAITQGYNLGPDLIDFVIVLTDNKHTRFVGTKVGGITLQTIFKQINVKSDIKVLRDTVIVMD